MKTSPNRKHSKAINGGLQHLGHLFGLTAAAKRQSRARTYIL